MPEPAIARARRVAFVSTRIAGTDGVSLEIAKWAHVIEEMGVECYYFTAESDRPDDRTVLIEEAYFNHPEILDINRRAFESERRTSELTDDIMRLATVIRDKLAAAVEEKQIDVLIAQNALTIPMNLPLGVAIVEAVQEGGLTCVAHHHDFYWERPRFLVSAVDDVLRYAFPPALPQIQHVVINSLAGQEFSRRTGLSCRIIPNVMDFDHPPAAPDDYAASFRSEIGMRDGELLILQPTRVVARKGIEHSIELVRRLGADQAKLVITHASGDEGDSYANRIREYAEMLGVTVLYVDDRIAEQRGTDAEGRRLYTLDDAFTQADLVAYPSEYEGFGNAFLEAVYHRRPVLCNRYTIYRTDIEPCGFRTVEFEDYLTAETVDEIRKVLGDDKLRQEIVDHNYEVAQEFFSYQVLKDELTLMIERPANIYRLLGRLKRFRGKDLT